MLLDELYSASRAGKLAVQPFVYTGTWLTLGATATTPVSINISNDADFVVRTMTGSAYTSANVPAVDPDLLLQFVDQGSGLNFQSAAMHWANCIGTAREPYVWPEPRLSYGGGSLIVTIQNLGGVAIGRVDLNLNGFKVRYLSTYSRESFLADAGVGRF